MFTMISHFSVGSEEYINTTRS